jgi:hypothetical protein
MHCCQAAEAGAHDHNMMRQGCTPGFGDGAGAGAAGAGSSGAVMTA